MLKAIILDVDAVLAQTGQYHRLACNAAFLLHGIDAKGSVGKYRELLKVTGGRQRPQPHFGARVLTVSDRDLRRIHRIKNEPNAQSVKSAPATCCAAPVARCG